MKIEVTYRLLQNGTRSGVGLGYIANKYWVEARTVIDLEEIKDVSEQIGTKPSESVLIKMKKDAKENLITRVKAATSIIVYKQMVEEILAPEELEI